MKFAPRFADEAERLAALRSYDVLDTPAEETFDDLTELAACICEAPIALISLVDDDRQWFKSRFGLDVAETARDIAFCAHAIHQPDLFIVEDALRDERFCDNPLVTQEPHIRFYAGAPLLTSEGHALGTLCVIDRKPRRLTPDRMHALRVLSRYVMKHLELRRRGKEAIEQRDERIRLIARLKVEQAALERQIAGRTEELECIERESGRELALADQSRRALLSLLEDQKQTEMALRQSEASLREQEEFFRLIAENIGDMVTVADLEGRRLYSSPAYRALYGDPETMKGASAFANIHPDDVERVRQGFVETVRSGVGARGYFRIVLPDASVREIESQGGVILGAEGRVERVVVVSRDVTARKRMEDEIRQINAELEERVHRRTAELDSAIKELETFTYSVSHDLKAPLRGIDGYSRLLLEQYKPQLDEEGRLFLNNVRRGVEQMSQLIDDMLAYSRMERHSLGNQTLDLAPLMARMLDERQADIHVCGMVVEMTGLHELSARADPEGLAMVLRNLVDNALKFARDSQPPTLTIRGSAVGNSVMLAVQDNGIGFDMKFHDRIFDIFQRLQRAEDYAGTGVGLAIVRKAMQRMDGRVWADSAPGRGATFFLELPR